MYILLIGCLILTFDYKILFPREELVSKKRLSNWEFWFATVLILAFLVIGSMLAFYDRFANPWSVGRNIDRFIAADLRAKDLAVMPQDWDKFKALHIDGLDMSDGNVRLVLSRIRAPNLSNRKIKFGDLRLSFLANTRFTDCEAEAADFSGAVLDGSSFWGCNLFGARFNNSSLNSVDFMGANITAVNFTGADLRFAKVMDLSQTFGDASTLLPSEIQRPAHWPNRADIDSYQKWLLSFEGRRR